METIKTKDFMVNCLKFNFENLEKISFTFQCKPGEVRFSGFHYLSRNFHRLFMSNLNIINYENFKIGNKIGDSISP